MENDGTSARLISTLASPVLPPNLVPLFSSLLKNTSEFALGRRYPVPPPPPPFCPPLPPAAPLPPLETSVFSPTIVPDPDVTCILYPALNPLVIESDVLVTSVPSASLNLFPAGTSSQGDKLE